MSLLPYLRPLPPTKVEKVTGKSRLDVSTAPIRTCLGCGRKRAQQKMFRFTVKQGDLVILDNKNRQSGRGGYCCPDRSCLESFVKKAGKLARAFRLEKVDCGSVQQLVDSFRRDRV